MMRVDGKDLDKDICDNMKQVTSKFGITVVCDEEEEAKINADMVLPADENCENVKQVASKVGYTVVCDEEA